MYQFPLPQAQVVAFQGQITSIAGIRGIPTLGLQFPCAYVFSLNDDSQEWKLRAKGAGEADDGVTFLLPNDYDSMTNNVIWVRTL